MVSNAFALSILAALCIAPVAHAATAATLTCYENSTGAPNLSLNISSLMLSEMPGTAGFFSVNTDLSNFILLSFSLPIVSPGGTLSGTYADCAFSLSLAGKSGGYPEQVVLEDVSLSIVGGQSLQATFSFQSLAFENPGAVKAPASTKVLTLDEKARALAAFMARVSSQAATQK